MPDIVIIATSPMTILSFMESHIKRLSGSYNISIITNCADPNEKERLSQLPATIYSIPIKRKIDPFSDIGTVLKIVSLCNKLKPHIVQSITPKAGLLGMLAARMTRVPIRVHWFTGQVWITKKGLFRGLLKLVDKLTGFLATDILIDSTSQMQFLIQNKIIKDSKAQVLGSGSVNGVDSSRFIPNSEVRRRIRADLEIGSDKLVLLFLGRLNRDKGVLDLVNAFKRLRGKYTDCILLLVGPDEGGLSTTIKDELSKIPGSVIFVEYVSKPELYYQAADIFCLPSYREGFGSVIIEAAACGVPAVATDIYGLRDSVEDGKTGLLSPAGNIDSLFTNIERLMLDKSYRIQLGTDARKRAVDKFSQHKLSDTYLDYVERLSTISAEKN